jgi:uncharacterized protein
MSLRLSEYALLGNRIYNGNPHPVRLVYVTTTAQLHTLPADTAHALETGTADRLPQAERQTLAEAEILTNGDQDVIAHQHTAARQKDRRKFTLLPTSYCNMGCSYCGQQHTKGAVRGRHRDAIADRVDRAMRNPSTRHVLVNWFGAEPMMGYAVIRSLSANFLESAQRHSTDYRARMITNGSLLTHRKLHVLHGECGINHMEITLDGPARVHDSHRPLKSGRRSYDHIVDTLAAALDDPELEGLSFSIRTNIDVNNCDHVEELFADLEHRGLNHPRVRMSLKPIHPWGNDIAELEISREQYATAEINWLSSLLGHRLNVELLPTAPTGSVCTAVTRSAEVIDTDGNLFSCTEHPLVPSERRSSLTAVTTLPPGELRPEGAFDDWHHDIRKGTYPCGACAFLPVCGGACPKAWAEGTVPCPSYKLNHQDRMHLAAQINGLQQARETA